MILTYTPLDEAWDLNTNDAPNSSNPKNRTPNDSPNSSTYQLRTRNNTVARNVQRDSESQNDEVQASNSGGSYDSMTINLDGFNPARIDVVISDTALIKHMKELSYTEQQALATKVLLTYFNENPNASIQPKQNNRFEIPPDQTNRVENPPKSSANIETYKPIFNTAPNSSYLRQPDNMGSNQIEFYKASDDRSPSMSNGYMYMLLAMLLYVLYEKTSFILSNQ